MRNAKSLSLVLLLAATSCGKATQPKPQCKAQQEEYAARYFPDGWDPATPPAGCTADDVVVGEALFLQYYKTDPVNGVPKIAIEPASFADAISVGEEHKVEFTAEPEYSIGTFKDIFPDDNNVCVAPKLADSSLKVPEIPADPMADPPIPETIPAVDLKYHWANLKMLTTPLSNAIHFGADLERTSGTCTLKYKVSAIYPVIQCGNGTKPKVDEMGNPIQGETEPDPSTGDPDPEACKPSIKGEAHGSGLSPDFAYDCPEHVLMCLPHSTFPSLVGKK